MGHDITPVAVPLAFLAGLASFLSPCVLPLLPGYLSYVGGRALAGGTGLGEVAVRAPARSVLSGTLVFVAGFSAVFLALGLSASLLGQFLVENRSVMMRVAGAVIVLMGLIYLGGVPLPWLYSERRMHARPREGRWGAFVMGLAFGFGWTPCLGPTLAAVLTVAATERTPGRGAALLLVYALGLGIPFVLSALGISRLMGALSWLRRHQRAIVRVSGTLLVAVGLLFLFNRVFWLSILLQRAMSSVGLDFWADL